MQNQISVTINNEKSKTYNIFLAENLLKDFSIWLPENDKKLVIITDETVKKLYGLSLKKNLESIGYETLLLAFPAGETHKNIHTKCALETQMFEQYCDRNTLILALGGGVVGDLAGFIAATYMRGIPFIQMPTTLLAMLDSSVGGKTGINTPQGKNLVGAFWQPIQVVSDISVLTTLPQEQLINGLMEAVKIFLTSDADSLQFLQKNQEAILHKDLTILQQIVERAVRLKAAIVMRDERESHERMVLNFGHTIGHALELLTNYELLHGYAVGYGILVEARIACEAGYLDEAHYLTIEKLLQGFGIHKKALQDFDIEAIIKATFMDKKKKGVLVRYVLLVEPGKVITQDNQWVVAMSESVVRKALHSII